MRLHPVTCLLMAALWGLQGVLAENAQAGSLARTRQAVRSEPAPKPDPPKESKPSKSGKLSSARRETRQHDKHNDDHHDDHSNDHRNGGHHVSHASSQAALSLGFFSLNRFDPSPAPCYAPPVCVGPPVYVQQPVYPAPTFVEPIVESFSNRFPAYPYSDGQHGAMVMGTSDRSASWLEGKAWSGRVQMEWGSDLDDLDRHGIAFFLESSSGLGIDFDWDSYSESLPAGGHDELHLGKFNVMYRIAETEHSLWRIGVGAAWLGDQVDTDFGVNFSIKADYMPSRPWVFSGELDLGTLGDAEMLHASGTVGLMINRCEIYGGYDYRRIGDAELSGPMLGLRVWF